MQLARFSAHALLVSVFLVVVGVQGDRAAFSMSGSATSPISDPRGLTQTACDRDPQAVCDYFHPNTVATGACAYGACFEMSRGEEIRVVAADERGDFPKTWFAWHEGTMTSVSCLLARRGNKTRLDFPGDAFRCKADLQTAEHLYYEHFASNPTNGCLGWVECRAY